MQWGETPDALTLTLGVLYVIGFLQSVLSGMLYKILPFLVWLHGRALGAGISNVRQALPERRMRLQFWSSVLALAALLLACRVPAVSRAAGALYALACGWLGVNLWLAARVYYRALRAALR